MRRAVVLFVVLVVVLGTLLGLRLVRDRRAAAGPSGGSVVVEGTTVDVRSRLNARVLALHVEEGSRVEKGAHLATLDCTEPEALLARSRGAALHGSRPGPGRGRRGPRLPPGQ